MVPLGMRPCALESDGSSFQKLPVHHKVRKAVPFRRFRVMEVRLVVYDATQDGDILEPEAAETVEAMGPTFNPQKKRERRADIVCIYRMERQQLGRLLKAGAMHHEVEAIKT